MPTWRSRLRRRLGRAAAALLVAALALTLLVAATGAAVTWRLTAVAEADWPPQGELVEVDGVALHVDCRGEGPLVLLVHGITGTTLDWQEVQGAGADRYRLCAVDRPGHGWSERPDDAGLTAQADLLVDLGAALGDPTPVLVGHSWAGQPLLLAALDRPAEVEAVVLVAAVTHPDAEASGPLLYRLAQAPVLGPALRATILTPLARPVVRDGVAESWAPQRPPPSATEQAVAVWTRPGQVDATTADSLADRRPLAGRQDEYPELVVPIAVVVGGQDRLVDPDAHGRRLAGQVPGAVLVERPDAGHAVPQVAPDAVLEALDRVVPVR